MTQFDLFIDYVPPQKVFAFPETRRVSIPRALAHYLADIKKPDRRAKLSGLGLHLTTDLRKAGLSEIDISAKVYFFEASISYELNRILSQKQNPPALIFSLADRQPQFHRQADRNGEAGARGQGRKALAGFGAAPHEGDSQEQDAARARRALVREFADQMLSRHETGDPKGAA